MEGGRVFMGRLYIASAGVLVGEGRDEGND